jgi:hypothetical protein
MRIVSTLLVLSSLIVGATAQSNAADVAAWCDDFARELGDQRSDPRAFWRLAKERVWEAYEWPVSKKQDVFDYLRNAPDGPGKGIAVLVVIGYRDPAGALALLDVAADPRTSKATRYYSLNAAPCVLGMGDVWVTKEQTEQERTDYIARLRSVAETAQKTSIGRAHADTITQMRAAAEKSSAPDELVMALWHVSAYQLGNLDLASRDALLPLLDDPGPTAQNVMFALALETNRSFLPESDSMAKTAKERELASNQALQSAKEWWQQLEADSRPRRARLVDSFATRGIDREHPESAASLRALRLQLDSTQRWTKYNAYRLFNEMAGTHYDLEFVFLLDKYSFHPMVTGLEAKEQEEELRRRVTAKLDAMIAGAK